MRLVILIFVGALLVVASIVSVRSAWISRRSVFVLAQPSGLGELIWHNPAATAVVNLPAEHYRTVIGADEIIYTRHRSDAMTFEFYVARWAPRNPSTYHAAAHPPEGCWPEAGWRCEEAGRFDFALSDGRALEAGESRRFSTPRGDSQEVVFWCISGQRIVPMPYRGSAPLSRDTLPLIVKEFGFIKYWWAKIAGGNDVKALEKAAAQAEFSQSEGAYFVRINSFVPVSSLVKSDDFAGIVPVLARLGLIKM